jgi:alpha-amylase
MLEGNTVTLRWQFEQLAGHRFSTMLNLAMPSCDGFLGRYMLADGSIPGGFGQPLSVEEASALFLEDGVLGGKVRLRSSPPSCIACRPQQTVSQSEAGFEKIMQGVELLFSWLIPDDCHTLELQLSLEASQP